MGVHLGPKPSKFLSHVLVFFFKLDQNCINLRLKVFVTECFSLLAIIIEMHIDPFTQKATPFLRRLDKDETAHYVLHGHSAALDDVAEALDCTQLLESRLVEPLHHNFVCQGFPQVWRVFPPLEVGKNAWVFILFVNYIQVQSMLILKLHHTTAVKILFRNRWKFEDRTCSIHNVFSLFFREISVGKPLSACIS